MSEFDLIQRYFTRATPGAVLGVGDDAALLSIGGGIELAISTDMLVSGTHFLPDADPLLLGHKTLAVNLSDLAAMGAQPRWALLSLSLPEADEVWLQKFSAGFFALAERHNVELIGGDTTRGPLNLCVTILGEVARGNALRRSGAQLGDDIWVSGKLGDAALALAHLQGRINLSDREFSACVGALHQPMPRVELGQALRDLAHSAIDISDGLLADLGHILESSRLGAEIMFAALPVSAVMRTRLNRSALPMNLKKSVGWARLCAHAVLSPRGHKGVPTLRYFRNAQSETAPLDPEIGFLLAGGDDYELCFTAPVVQRSNIDSLSAKISLPLTRIGTIVAGRGCVVRAADGSVINIGNSGYDHFR